MIKNKEEFEKIGIKTKSKGYKTWSNAGLLNNIDENFAKEVRQYWEENYGKKVNPALHMVFLNLTGRKDIRLIPGNIMLKEILPTLNDYSMSAFYGDKNIYDIIIKPLRSPETVIRNIRGAYYDSYYNNIESESAYKVLLSSRSDLIIKPSRTNNGKGIEKLNFRDNKLYMGEKAVTIDHLQELYKEDFIIQKVIQQHPNMAAPHPASVNTFRMVTFRWKNEVHHLLTYARFGSDNDIRDNIGTGGIRLGITDSGEFLEVAITKNGKKLTHHPTTGYCFADLDPISNFDEFMQFVKDAHKKFLHLDFISWDIAVGLDGKPIFIEANFAGSPSFYQMAAQRPMFGDLTEEVLQYVNRELKNREPLLMKKHRIKIEEKKAKKQEKKMEKNSQLIKELKEKNRKMKKQKRDLKQQLEYQKMEHYRIKTEYNQLNEKYTNVLNSKSFRYTRPIRKISKLLRR